MNCQRGAKNAETKNWVRQVLRSPNGESTLREDVSSRPSENLSQTKVQQAMFDGVSDACYVLGTK